MRNEEQRRRAAVDAVMAATDPHRGPAQRALLYALRKGQDVSVTRLYGRISITSRDHRTMQQYIGSPISKLNRKLAEHGFRILPGEKRGTYRLRPIN